ncbi:MAG: FHA domain-containing protein, partial [Deltaproteobacteria bacterium]|nr:FHA domain-containing protein [Deltaproteobacteria bacterium]
MAILRIRSPVMGSDERVFEWDGRPITLGRDESCDVVLLEQAASRQHARLERTDAGIMLHDAGSGNGVWVGDQRVQSRPLADGETFRIGATTVELVLDPYAQPTLIGERGELDVAAADGPPSDAAEPRASIPDNDEPEAAPTETGPAEAAGGTQVVATQPVPSDPLGGPLPVTPQAPHVAP